MIVLKIDWGDVGGVSGETAGTWLYKVTFKKTIDEKGQDIRRQLEEYCMKGTEGLIHLLNKLREMVTNSWSEDLRFFRFNETPFIS